MQFYCIPELIEAKCNVVIWLDGSVQIKMGAFLDCMADRATRGQNFVVYVHERDYLADKVQASIGFGKYLGQWDVDKFGQHQHVDMQYQYYLWMGFNERWFEATPWFNESVGIMEYMSHAWSCLIYVKRKPPNHFLTAGGERTFCDPPKTKCHFLTVCGSTMLPSMHYQMQRLQLARIGTMNIVLSVIMGSDGNERWCSEAQLKFSSKLGEFGVSWLQAQTDVFYYNSRG